MRKGLGINRGRGYFNLVPQDHIVHSLSAKGVKTYSKKTLAKKFSDFNVIAIHTGKNLQDPKVKGFAIETKDEPYDRSNAIFDRIPEAKNVQAIRNMAKGYYYSVLFAKGKKHTGKDKEKYLADYKTYKIYRLDRWSENDDDDEYGEHQVGSELYLVAEDEADKFGEWMADEYGGQDYNNKINLHTLGTMKGAEIMEIAHKYHEERKKTTKYNLDAKDKTLSAEYMTWSDAFPQNNENFSSSKLLDKKKRFLLHTNKLDAKDKKVELSNYKLDQIRMLLNKGNSIHQTALKSNVSEYQIKKHFR